MKLEVNFSKFLSFYKSSVVANFSGVEILSNLACFIYIILLKALSLEVIHLTWYNNSFSGLVKLKKNPFRPTQEYIKMMVPDLRLFQYPATSMFILHRPNVVRQVQRWYVITFKSGSKILPLQLYVRSALFSLRRKKG